MQLDVRIRTLVRQIEESLRSLFPGRNPSALYEPMAYILDAGGKRIRPLLLALSCRSVGGGLDGSLDAAVAVELLHTFTLVHDDIMDHDGLRRGKPTVHKKWDESTAILAGDGLVTAAYDSLLKTRHPDLIRILKIFTQSLMVLCEGQAMDKTFESREDVTADEYFDMIGKKTARLIETSCEIGGILGGGTEEEIASLARFGSELGLAFQIQDDLLDVASREEILGKPVGSDISERKKTILSIHFLGRADIGQRARFMTFWGKKNLTAADTAEMGALFEQTGTFDDVRKVIGLRTEGALASLDRLRSSQAREDLRELALALLKREF
jgi:geranylgeranyl diphosphate synthase type II